MEIWDQKNNRKCLGFPQYLYVKFVTLIPVIFGADVRDVTEEGSYYILRVEKSLSDGIMNYKLWSLSRPSSSLRHRCLAPWEPGDFCCTETERAVVYRGVPWCTLLYTGLSHSDLVVVETLNSTKRKWWIWIWVMQSCSLAAVYSTFWREHNLILRQVQQCSAGRRSLIEDLIRYLEMKYYLRNQLWKPWSTVTKVGGRGKRGSERPTKFLCISFWAN